MGLNFGTVQDAGAKFFKATDFTGAIALFVEPTGVDPHAMNKEKTKEVLNSFARVSVFRNAAQLEALAPEVGDYIFGQVVLAKAVAQLHGSGQVGLVRLTKPGEAFQFENVTDPQIMAKVVEYHEKREAAAAAALASRPQF